MKTLKLITVGVFLFVSSLVHSQVSVNVNIGVPPPWGPVGYANVGFYYLPDVEAYYDIHASQFIYFSGGKWIRGTYLPGPHRHYDLYSGYKVVLNDYHGSKPYTNFNSHKVKYHKGYKGKPQQTIGKNPKHHSDSGNHGNGNNGNSGHKEGKGNSGNGKGKH
ncbi:MAG TPA: hypothetical protein VIV55_00135 [Flavobacterium sp.]